jgi:hypothetical protein
MKTAKRASLKQAAAALALSCCAAGVAQAAVTITIINSNKPGEGFNDPTPAAPVGGNNGTTLGQQRLIAFQHAADLWGATLTSSVPIRVAASFEPLACTANSAVLGSAGTWDVFADFANAPRPGTWYPSALANKLAGTDLAQPNDPHIVARFNSKLGLAPDCMPGSGFYLGLDDKFGDKIDLVTVLLHELGHGLGFQTFTDDATGQEIQGKPSIWDYYLVDNKSNKSWVEMSDAERVASAISGTGLSWTGPNVTAAVPQVLSPVSNLAVNGPAAGDASGNYAVGDASFGPPLGANAVSGQLMPVVDQPDGTGTACTALSPVNALAVRNNIALVDRGACAFVVKAKMVQDAGAIGMVLADNQAGDVSDMSGADPSIVIPSVRITQADGVKLKAALKQRSRTSSGVLASLGIDPSRLAGTDAARRILMYTPTTLEPGSSVSHYHSLAKRNQLMEPAINTDLAHETVPPRDLTFPLLRDIGW